MTTQSDVPIAGTSAPAHERDLVLAVDDNEQNLQILEEYLTSWGYDVAMARDGREALALYPGSNPSIIVLDVMMPNMDGYEACARIKGETATLDRVFAALDRVFDALQGDQRIDPADRP